MTNDLRSRPTGNGAANETPAIGPAVGSKEPEGAAPRQGPQTGAEGRSASQAASRARDIADAPRRSPQGPRRGNQSRGSSAGGTWADGLMNYLEHLRDLGAAHFISRVVKDSWREIAKAADAAKAGRR